MERRRGVRRGEGVWLVRMCGVAVVTMGHLTECIGEGWGRRRFLSAEDGGGVDLFDFN